MIAWRDQRLPRMMEIAAAKRPLDPEAVREAARLGWRSSTIAEVLQRPVEEIIRLLEV